MEKGYSLKNILKNTTTKQKVLVVLFLVIIVALLVALFVLIGLPQNESSESEGDSNADTSTVVDNEPIMLEEGITGAGLENDNNDSVSNVQTPVSTEFNEEHDYTLSDYVPMDSYSFIDYGDNQSGLRIYWSITENTAVDKGIVITLDSCDEAGNKADANRYLKTIPMDISEYTIVYRVEQGEVPCEVPNNNARWGWEG